MIELKLQGRRWSRLVAASGHAEAAARQKTYTVIFVYARPSFRSIRSGLP